MQKRVNLGWEFRKENKKVKNNNGQEKKKDNTLLTKKVSFKKNR